MRWAVARCRPDGMPCAQAAQEGATEGVIGPLVCDEADVCLLNSLNARCSRTIDANIHLNPPIRVVAHRARPCVPVVDILPAIAARQDFRRDPFLQTRHLPARGGVAATPPARAGVAGEPQSLRRQ